MRWECAKRKDRNLGMTPNCPRSRDLSIAPQVHTYVGQNISCFHFFAAISPFLGRSSSDAQKQFKTEVSRVIGAEGKYLRLISAGKMLNPDEAHVKDFGLTENCYVHCVVTAAPPRLHLPSLTPEQAEEEVRLADFFSLVFSI